jgi:hypothetical protein
MTVQMHHQPVAIMGAFEKYLKGNVALGRAPLRPIDPRPEQIHKFGNPFKINKVVVLGA